MGAPGEALGEGCPRSSPRPWGGQELADPALLAFALNGFFLQSFARPGLAAVRDGIGSEILDLAAKHDLPTYAALGRLIRLQSASALGDLTAATAHAEAAEQLAPMTEAPLVPALAAAPEPPHDHMQEAMWCLTALAAAHLADPAAAARAAAALTAARTEHAGAASGLLTFGPVSAYLAEAHACAELL
jgi:hypothetical protein